MDQWADLSLHLTHMSLVMRGSEGETGGPEPHPLKNNNAIEFLSDTGLDPWKITKLPSQHSMFVYHLPASKRHLIGILLTVQRWPTFSGVSMLSSLIQK